MITFIMIDKKLEYILIIITILVSALFQGLYFFEQYVLINILIIFYSIYLIYICKGIKEILSPIFVILITFCSMYVISFFWSNNKINAFEEIIRILGFIPALTIGFFMDKKRYISFEVGIIISSIIVAIIGFLNLAEILNIDGTMYMGRMQSTIQYANVTALFFLVAFIFSFKVFLKNKIKFNIINIILINAIIFTFSRTVWIFLGLICLVIIFANWFLIKKCDKLSFLFILIYSFALSFVLSNTKGVAFVLILLLGLIIGIIPELFKQREKRLKIYVISISFFVFITLGLILFSNNSIVERISKINLQSTELHARIAYYKGAINVLKDYPFTGCGVRGWESICESYVGDYSKFVHNYYLQIVCDTGIIGIIIFFAFIVYVIKNKNNDNYSFAVIIIILLHSIVDVTMHFQLMAIIFFVVCGNIVSSFRDINNNNSSNS